MSYSRFEYECRHCHHEVTAPCCEDMEQYRQMMESWRQENGIPLIQGGEDES